MYSWVSLQGRVGRGEPAPPRRRGAAARVLGPYHLSPHQEAELRHVFDYEGSEAGCTASVPRLATLMQHLPPGTRTLLTSSQTVSRKPRYSSRVRFLSYSFPTLYGGEVTTRWTLLSGISSIFSLDLQMILSRYSFLIGLSTVLHYILLLETLVEPAAVEGGRFVADSFLASRRRWSSFPSASSGSGPIRLSRAAGAQSTRR